VPDPPSEDACCLEDDDLLGEGLTAIGKQLAVAGFNAIWAGQARRPEELLPGSPAEARRTAALLAARGRAELDDDRRLVGIHGLTLRPGRHTIEHEHVPHFTWCAFDAIGIPAALGLVESQVVV